MSIDDFNIRSNPGWTDIDIINAVRSRLGLESSEPWDVDFASFRRNLVATIWEGGLEFTEPVVEIGHILKGLEILLSKEYLQR